MSSDVRPAAERSETELDVHISRPLTRPQMLRYHSSPVIPNHMSPTRQQFRLGNTKPREIKETLDATHRADKFGKTIIINQYKLENDIAKASYGSVRVAVDEKTNMKYAVKEYSKSQLQKACRMAMMKQRRILGKPNSKAISAQEDLSPLGMVKREVAIMKKLDHPNVVSLVEVLDDPHGDSLYMIMEWCDKGTVLKSDHEGNSPFSEEQCRLMFRDLILGIEYLHSQGVIHRDIKADNVLLDEDDVVKIVDFGVSELFEKDNDVIKKTAGSPAYMAPELSKLSNGTNMEAVQQVAGRPADIWSMGVTLYYLLTGILPFKADTLMELFDCIINQTANVSMFGDDLKDLFSRLLEKDPRTRITMRELRKHAWVTCRGQDELLSYEENTSEKILPITEEDLESAFELIEGVMDVDIASEKLKRLHGWRGTNIKSRDSSPESFRSKTPPMEESMRRLTHALGEIVSKRIVSSSHPSSIKSLTPPLHTRASESPPQGNDRNDSSEDEPRVERRRSRSRHREHHPLKMTAIIDRSQSLDANLQQRD